jgi:carbon starvation protein
MLTEGFLATLVIIACAAGVGLGSEVGGELLVGENAWSARYASWGSAGSLGAKVAAFVDGAANLLRSIGISSAISLALMAVLVASFAGTTLDTACRLQRYVVQELATTLGEKPALATSVNWLRHRHGATLFAIIIAAIVAAAPAPGQVDWSLATSGKGGLILWPLFGATNQLLAGLAFLVITFHLWRRRKPILFLILPALFMLIMPMWAMMLQLFFGTGAGPSWVESGSWVLVGVGLVTIALEVWMLVEAVIMFPKVRGVLERVADTSLEKTSIEPS